MPKLVDITNHQFGRLTVIRVVERRNRRWHWLCQCDCGQTAIVSSKLLRSGKTTSCGCRRLDAKVDLTSQQFGRLTAIVAVEKYRGQWCWSCQCSCGQVVVVQGAALRNGHTTSCGCRQRETVHKLAFVHGNARDGNHSVEYVTWKSMLQRCNNPNHPSYKNYGGRGITVCKRWHDFVNFFADMGLRPIGKYSIERVDNNGNYEPSNCIWLPLNEQYKNQRPRRDRIAKVMMPQPTP